MNPKASFVNYSATRDNYTYASNVVSLLLIEYITLRFAGLFPIPIYWDWIVRPTNFSTLCF